MLPGGLTDCQICPIFKCYLVYIKDIEAQISKLKCQNKIYLKRLLKICWFKKGRVVIVVTVVLVVMHGTIVVTLEHYNN